ncbi:phosphoadenosine phosphosulfate reductase family protein [Enterobacter kobei]|uniref:phosphoadenosine phosphosulfate reductase domain-containing protein n=1 Tax=Enterobacter kobei TaxID=208224 RepID=UPI002149E0EA|nr:phosphoadenosine phosphosulfate reductase family protein [Enterobacter kobei]MCR2796159.1 phosphoadenosine phosphosulfate reductase family protein [Enterobacter kobei]
MTPNEKQKLLQRQSLSLDAKIEMTKRRIRDFYDHFDGEVYQSFSGGKDSTVLRHIIMSMGLKMPFVFSNTGLEMPEIVDFVRAQPARMMVSFRLDQRFRLTRYGRSTGCQLEVKRSQK